MTSYEETIEKFLSESKNLGIKIHEDYKAAKELFEAIEKGTNFDSIVLQINPDTLIKACNAFGAVVLDWNEQYPRSMTDYRQILGIVIEDIKQIKGITIHQSENKIQILFDNKEFIYHFDQNMMLGQANLVVPEETKALIAQQENQIIQEFAEIITLDLYILHFLSNIQLLNNKYSIQAVAQTLKVNKTIDPVFFDNLHKAALWWLELKKTLDKLKELTYTAVQIDDVVTKDLARVFNEEKLVRARDAKIRASKAGLSLACNIILNLVPYGGSVSTFYEIYGTVLLNER